MRFLKNMLLTTLLLAMLPTRAILAALPEFAWGNETGGYRHSSSIFLTLSLGDISSFSDAPYSSGTTWDTTRPYIRSITGQYSNVLKASDSDEPYWALGSFLYWPAPVYVRVVMWYFPNYGTFFASCVTITRDKKIVIKTDLSLEPQTPDFAWIVWWNHTTNEKYYLRDYLNATIPELADYIDATKSPDRVVDDTKKCLTTTFALKTIPLTVPRVVVVRFDCTERNHLPLGIEERAWVTNLNPPVTVEAETAATPSIPSNPALLEPPMVLEGQIFPDRRNHDLLHLMVILNKTGYEISFVTRIFSTAGGKPLVIDEKRTPWGRENAVTINNRKLNRSAGERLRLQHAAEIRYPGSQAPGLTYIFD